MDLELRVSVLEGIVNQLVEENTALQEKIELKVSKGDVTSELNIEAGRLEASEINLTNLKEEE